MSALFPFATSSERGNKCTLFTALLNRAAHVTGRRSRWELGHRVPGTDARFFA